MFKIVEILTPLSVKVKEEGFKEIVYSFFTKKGRDKFIQYLYITNNSIQVQNEIKK